jgi:hypothetical protein
MLGLSTVKFHSLFESLDFEIKPINRLQHRDAILGDLNPLWQSTLQAPVAPSIFRILRPAPLGGRNKSSQEIKMGRIVCPKCTAAACCLKPERITKTGICRRRIPGECHRPLRPILDVRTGSANKTALCELFGIVSILVTDDRTISALRAFDPHLCDIAKDALTSINEIPHVF